MKSTHARRFARTPLPTTSTVFSAPSARPKPSSLHPTMSPSLLPAHLLPRLPSRPLLLLLLLSLLLLLPLLPRPPASPPPAADLRRYTHAAAHFRAHLDPAALREYNLERAAILDAADPLRLPAAQHLADFVIADPAVQPFFQKCLLLPDHAVLHPSLRRGPDPQELAARRFAKQPRDFDDTFATVDRKRFFFHPDRSAVHTVDALAAGLDTDLDDAIAVAVAVVEHDAAGPLDDLDLPVAYLRTTRRDGTQAIINIGGTVNKTRPGSSDSSESSDPSAPAPVRVRRVVSVTRGYGRPCEASFIRPRELVRIHVLLAYSERPHRLEAFLKMFADYFKASNTDLIRIVVSTTKQEKDRVVKTAKAHPQLTPARFAVLVSKGDEFGNFSRAVAMRDAANTVPKDEVIFLSDADLAIGGNFLQNCRVNIVKGYQVWFPVMFSLYPYGKSLSSRDGLWRRSSYGMACMYKNDFSAVGGFGGKEETAFTGWGSEDVFLYNQFRDSEKYAVLRTLEPGLRHHWHGKDCEQNENYENCMRTVYMTIGSQDAIAKLMSEKRVDISSLTKDALPV